MTSTNAIFRGKSMLTTIEYARSRGIQQAYPDASVAEVVAALVAEVERLQVVVANSPEGQAAATQTDPTPCACGHPRSEHGDGVVHTACCDELRCACDEFEAIS